MSTCSCWQRSGEGHCTDTALSRSCAVSSEGAFDLAEGTVYPALYRLERAGLLTSKWTKAAGRRRRRCIG